MKYGQFCPIAKAAEVLCERWTLLIIREMLLGSTRYNEFQRAISKISPTLLSKRLTDLEKANLIVKQKVQGGRSYEYHLTQAGKELEPIVTSLGVWGMEWARDQMGLDDQDVELLMWDIRRCLAVDRMPSDHAVLKFHFPNLEQYRDWWIVIDENNRDLCTEDPQKDVDLFFTSDAQVLIDVWMGDRVLTEAVSSGDLKIIGDTGYRRSVKDWFSLSLLADHGRVLKKTG